VLCLAYGYYDGVEFLVDDRKIGIPDKDGSY